ncbi:MAG TPA: gas vesicle protein [Isosphaeraceae bacterium]|nr:gas vesicle protein [Isosphaeraceae bacterium]
MAGAIELSPNLVNDTELDTEKRITLCETLDRVLNKGVVLAGEIVISVADVDLVYLNVQVLLTSVQTVCRVNRERQIPSSGLSLPLSPTQS